MKKEKSKVSKIFKTIATVATAGVAVIAGVIALNQFGVIGGGNNPSNPPTHERLSQVTNVSFDEKTNTLSWNEVEHANMYKVDINGKQKQVETNYYVYMPVDKVSDMKVQAIDTTGVYESSKWSDTFTYTISDNTISTQSVFAFVNKLDRNSELVNIASLYINNNMLYSKCHVINSNGKDKVMSYETSFDRKINSLQEAMNAKVLGTDKISEYDYSRYKSAEYFLKSNSYVGQMEEYRKQGYDFKVVSSEVADQGVDGLTMYGTYRLTKGDDIKYIANTIEVAFYNPSTSKAVNYTTKLQNANEVNAGELDFHELTGDFYDWANLTYESNQARTNTTSQLKTTTSGIGMDL